MSTAKVVDPAQADGEARFLASLDGSSRGIQWHSGGKRNDESFDTESEARLALLNKDMQDQVRRAPAPGRASSGIRKP